jgi:hypothetical protein
MMFAMVTADTVGDAILNVWQWQRLGDFLMARKVENG